MNVPGFKMKRERTPGVFEALKIAIYVGEEKASTRQLANLDLYKSCLQQIINDDTFDTHILMMPDMSGPNLVYADNDEDLVQSVATLTGKDVGYLDMIVVMGGGVLSGDWGENEMMEIVLADISAHLNRLWPVADRTSGKMGKHIGWASIAGVIAGAHAVLRMLEPQDAMMERIKDAAGKGIVEEIRGSASDERLVMLQNRPALEAIEKVCQQAQETHGDYLNLPATGSAIANAAKAIFLNAVDSMVHPPRAIM